MGNGSGVAIKAIKSISSARPDLSNSLDGDIYSPNRRGEKYCNTSNDTIYIKNNFGLVIPIHPNVTSKLTKKFSITQRISLDYNSAVLARNIISKIEIPENYYPSKNSMFKALDETGVRQNTNRLNCDYVIESIIDISELDEREVRFNHDSGYLISYDFNQLAMAIHPSVRTVLGSEIEEGDIFLTSTLKIEIISNEETISPRYANVFGKIVKIVPTLDFERLSGIYVSYIERNEVVNSWDYSLDSDPCVTGFFMTEEEAKCHGDIEVAKLRLKLAETETSLETIEKQTVVKDQEIQIKDKDLELTKRKTERDTFLQERDAYYSTRKLQLEAQTDSISHTNKTNLEYLKIIPAVITFAALMYAVGKGKN